MRFSADPPEGFVGRGLAKNRFGQIVRQTRGGHFRLVLLRSRPGRSRHTHRHAGFERASVAFANFRYGISYGNMFDLLFIFSTKQTCFFENATLARHS